MFIAGAGNLRYGEIIEVIDAAKGAGVTKVGIVTTAMRRSGGADARRTRCRTRSPSPPDTKPARRLTMARR